MDAWIECCSVGFCSSRSIRWARDHTRHRNDSWFEAAEAFDADAAPADGGDDDDWHADGESAFDGTLGGGGGGGEYGGEYMAPDSVTDRLVTGTGALALEDDAEAED